MAKTPDRETWRLLLRPALRVVDSLHQHGYGRLDFRLGGGTVLMFRLDHRISKDIDLFTNDAQAIGFLSPRLNEVAAAEAQDYEEQANSVKLVLPEGDIDFIASGTVVTSEPEGTLDFAGRSLALDATAEILAKKLLYRAASFKARDVFDMATALALAPAAALQAIRATENVHPALLRRLSALSLVAPDELTADILFTEAGRPHAENMVRKVMDAVADLDRHGSSG